MLLRALMTILALLAGCGWLPAAAQDNFVLVIDGSSSMWGQVGGQTKIDVLKRSLSQVLDQLDTTADVGVVAFGHREKGNCADIEELVPPQPFDPALIQAAIDNIQPKGKTPLSDAVRFAAEELRFTEEKATIVILGDGGENCGMDPCAVAEELEKTGVDLTVHAIAFDIADEEGSRQLQCFASATGGLFLPVADAPELVAALQAVQKKVESPKPVTVRIEPTDSGAGGPVVLPLDWVITRVSTGEVQSFEGLTGSVELPLMPGDYFAGVHGKGVAGEVAFSVGEGSPAQIRIGIAVPTPPQVRLVADDPANGQPITGKMVWTFTDVASAATFRLEAAAGSVSDLIPAGEYHVFAEADGASGRTQVSVSETGTTDVVLVLAPPTANVRLIAIDAATGSPIAATPITWTFVNVATEETIGIDSVPNEGVTTQVPPGTYDVIAEVGGGFGEAQVTVSAAATNDVVVQVMMPEAPLVVAGQSFPAGSAVPVRWNFDGRPSDLVFILPSGDRDNTYPLDDWRRQVVGKTRSATLTAPALPGNYDVRYFSKDAGGLVHRVAVRITPAEGQIAGPATAMAGESVEVTWIGPNLFGDFLFVAPLDWDDNAYPMSSDERVLVTGRGKAQVGVPEREGQYEYRYFSAGGGGVLFRAPVLVAMPGARVSAPASVVAGSAFDVAFSGPRDAEDRLFIAAAGGDRERYPLGSEALEAVQHGSPAALVAPVQPGTYEVRYYSRDKGGLLATAPFTVTAAMVEIDAPRLIQRASDLRFQVKGPVAPGDILFIAPNDWKDNTYPLGADNQLSFGHGGDAIPIKDGFYAFVTVAPAKAGVYEIRYFSWANGDVLYRRALIVK